MDAPTSTGIRVPQWKCHQPLEPKGASTMKITTVGIDLATNVFQVHGIDEHGKAVLKKQLRRDQMAAFFVNLSPCLIGMEACGNAHQWGRKLQSMGHTVRLMAPQFVKPYVKTNKNYAADAETICEAVGRPNMRFVPVKNVEQQAVLKELDRQVEELEDKIHAWHRSCDLSRKLAMAPGMGPSTASALVASIGDAKNFDGGRQVAAWLGIINGGKARRHPFASWPSLDRLCHNHPQDSPWPIYPYYDVLPSLMHGNKFVQHPYH